MPSTIIIFDMKLNEFQLGIAATAHINGASEPCKPHNRMAEVSEHKLNFYSTWYLYLWVSNALLCGTARVHEKNLNRKLHKFQKQTTTLASAITLCV